jgi:hypothetical protein
MVILNEGLNRIRDLINNDIDKGQLGTATTAANENDTELGSPVASTLLTVSKTLLDREIKFDYTLPSTGGVTATYTEFELQKSSGPVNFDRIVFTGIAFSTGGTEDLLISKKWFIRNQ